MLSTAAAFQWLSSVLATALASRCRRIQSSSRSWEASWSTVNVQREVLQTLKSIPTPPSVYVVYVDLRVIEDSTGGLPPTFCELQWPQPVAYSTFR